MTRNHRDSRRAIAPRVESMEMRIAPSSHLGTVVISGVGNGGGGAQVQNLHGQQIQVNYTNHGHH